MLLGLLNFYNSLFLVLSSSALFVSNFFPLVGGALAFFAGLTCLDCTPLVENSSLYCYPSASSINALLVFRLPEDDACLGLKNRLGEIIYRIENPYAYRGFIIGLDRNFFADHSIFVSERN